MRLRSKGLAFACLALFTTAADAKPLVRAKPYARASLTADGPWLANPTDPDPNERSILEIEDDKGKRVLVTTYCESGFVQLYLDRAGLGTLAVADTELHPIGPTSAAGARLGQGMRIDEATPQADGTSRVTIHWEWGDATIDLAGVVPTAALGTRYEPGVVHSSARHPPRPKLDIVLPASFQLLDGAAGHVFATRNGKDAVPATTVTTLGAYTLVSVDLAIDHFLVTGWIRSQLVKPPPPGRDDEMVGGLLGVDGEHRDTQADVYDAIGGRVIGHLRSVAREKPVARSRDWTRYDIATQFGIAPVWVKDADLTSNRLVDLGSYGASAVPAQVSASQLTVGNVRVKGDYDAAVAQRYVKRQRVDLLACYDELPWSARANASIDIVFSLDANGVVTASSIGATPAMADVASCVHAVLMAVLFPKPKGGTAVQLSTSLAFSRQQR